MDQQLLDDLVVWVKRARKTPRPLFWFFCFKGEDGEPVLLVGKKRGEILKKGRETRKTAKDKKFSAGEVKRGEDGQLVFGILDGTAPVKLVTKAFHLRLAKEDGLKAVRGLLKKATILEREAYEALGVEAEASTDTTSASKDTSDEADDTLAKKRRDAAKKAIDKAKKRLGKGFDELAEVPLLNRLGKQATVAMKAGDFEEAVALFEAVAELAEGLGLPVPDDEIDGEDEGDWLDDGIDVSDVDPAALLALWTKALARTDVQIGAAQKFLKAKAKSVTDQDLSADLVDIADKGLGALTGSFRVPLQASLMEARGSSGPARDKALVKAVSLANKFVDKVYDDPRFEACDRLDLGGRKMTLRRTLGDALRQIADAG